MLRSLDVVNFHINTDWVIDSVHACVEAFMCQILRTSMYKKTITIVPAGGDTAKNSTFTTEVTSG